MMIQTFLVLQRRKDVRFYQDSSTSKAFEKLGWKPSTNFEQLVQRMIDADWKLAREEVALAAHAKTQM